ncbi:alpha/beta hydrolase family esterase [Nocardia stercoris]|uniref:alpha/beta hydrolase family esterase n=1 Tax=Nocardia stercoris TaxID=2483361 RepID=UPI00131A4853|nr:PHB depolymerase family esterase [Nocardia stercoris]
MLIDGHERTFTLRPPATPRPGLPLILVLHGNRATDGRAVRGGDDTMRRWTSFDTQADRFGAVVAYPDAFTGSWADGRGVTTGDESGVDDVAFLRAVIDLSAEQHGTRPDHTVVAGISNGAFMAHRLALEASDRVAAFGAVAGALPAALSDLRPTHSVSALLINGTADAMVPIDGGYSRRRGPDGELRGRTHGLAESARRWADWNGCGTVATVADLPAGAGPDEFAVSRWEAGAGAGGTRVAAWTVHGMGHTWPGASVPAALAALQPTPRNFDAAAELCRFALPQLASADDRRH